MNVKDVNQTKDRISMAEKEIAALKVSINGIRLGQGTNQSDETNLFFLNSKINSNR